MTYIVSTAGKVCRPSTTPQDDFGQTLLERVQHAMSDPWVTVEQVGRDRQRVNLRSLQPGSPARPDLQDVDTEDPQGMHVLHLGNHNGHVPSGHPAVEQPATGGFNNVKDACSDDIEPIPHIVPVVDRSPVQFRASRDMGDRAIAGRIKCPRPQLFSVSWEPISCSPRLASTRSTRGRPSCGGSGPGSTRRAPRRPRAAHRRWPARARCA